MRSLLTRLDSNEALLMMYLAGELPAEDRAELEQMLQADGALRAQLEELRELQSAVTASLDRLEAVPAAPDELSVRRVMRVLRQEHLERQVRAVPVQDVPVVRRRSTVGYAALGVAAAVVLSIGLWGLGVLDKPDQPIQPSGTPGVAILPFGDDSSAKLDEAEEHIRALKASDDEDDRLLLMM